ncbi:pre-B-cell leukemia transcription factor-interacting protein 1 isoform X2 [Pelobates fuscus]|uniref:pre-B-cell leukemia transcription factor-interacting protein 1 isoform X2 n=1 Tax=Pelobates fuscus TaxID=191477 RepID=UPI002FE4AAE4
MADAADSRDSENNWVIANNEAFPVETLGAAQTGSPNVPEDHGPADSEKSHKAEEIESSSSLKETKDSEPPSLPAETLIPEQQVDITPEEPEVIPEDTEQLLPKPRSAFTSKVEHCVLSLAQYIPDTLKSWGESSASRTDEDLEEVSCSSSDDDVEGLRKRKLRGTSPVSVGAVPKEVAEQEEDGGFGLTLNKCIIAALALIGIGFLAFSGGFGTEEDSPQTVITRSVSGEDGQPQAIADIQDWMEKHAAQFSGDPGSFKVISDLLDKVAKENQDIRHMQAKLQAQKEELESLLNISESERVSPSPQHEGLSEENIRLKDVLLKEETAHLSAQEELQSLQEKLETLEGNSLESQQLVLENTKLKEELDISRKQIESFLTQKETLVAESQMLRQELDKQRSLVASIRRDLESLTTQQDTPDLVVDEQQLQGKISDLSSRLALEVQRSETWEKTYVEHAEKRKAQVGDHSHKEWKKGERQSRTSNMSISAGEFKKFGKDHGRRQKEGEVKEPQHEEWKRKKHEHREEQKEQPWHNKKHREWEREQQRKELQTESTVEELGKIQEQRHSDSAHHSHENTERNWKEKHSKHHHGETEGGFHPRKGQKDFHAQKEEEDNHKRKEQGEKKHKKDSHHRHHEHNKFWKKLSDHQYRIPEGCSGLEDCARKDGIDLFNLELKPVQRKQFEDLLKSYLAKTNFSDHLPGLIPLLDGFFEGPVFSHDKIRFRDFVDDVEDFLEDLAKKETGSDDAVDDFEKYVYIHFFGEEATKKKRYNKKDAHKKTDPDKDHWKKSSIHEPHHHRNTEPRKKPAQMENSQAESRHKSSKEGKDPHTSKYKPSVKTYRDNDVPSHQNQQRTPNRHYQEKQDDKDHKYEHEGTQNYKSTKYHFHKDRDEHGHKKFNPRYEEEVGLNYHHVEKGSNFKKEQNYHQLDRKTYKPQNEKREGDAHGYKHKKYDTYDESWSQSRHKKNKEEVGHQKYGDHKPTFESNGKPEQGHKAKYTSPHNQNERDGKPVNLQDHKLHKQKHEKDMFNKHHKMSKEHHREYESHDHYNVYQKSPEKKPWKESRNHEQGPDEFSYNKDRKAFHHYSSDRKSNKDRNKNHHKASNHKWQKENPRDHKHNINTDGDN